MPNRDDPSKSANAFKTPSWLAVLLVMFGLGYAFWQNNLAPIVEQASPTTATHQARDADDGLSQENLPPEHEPSIPEIAPESEGVSRSHRHSKSHVEDDGSVGATNDESSYKIKNQSIHDLNGRVVYRGTIDLKPTLDRIAHGESNRHRNDGTSFQNREGHLPRKPAGYYKEYVHPTPGEKGPGPQRIIIGEDGDIWYTPNHYKTFKQIKSEKT